MNIEEKDICEYIFNLLPPQRRLEVKDAIECDDKTRQEYERLTRKFDRLKILESDFANPLYLLYQSIIKNSAIAALLIIVFSLWLIPFSGEADNEASLVSTEGLVGRQSGVCCTSGISPQAVLKFEQGFQMILVKNLPSTSSIESEMNYPTQYIKNILNNGLGI